MPNREQFRARTEEIAEAHRAVPVSAGELKRLRESNAELIEALELIAEQCEEHPMYIPDATEADMLEIGGDSASITYWAQVARAALAKVKS